MSASTSTAANTNQKAAPQSLPVPEEARAPSPSTEIAPAPSPAPETRKRRGGRSLLMLSVPLALVAGGVYFWATGGRYEETDNANLRQARISVTADTSGRIVESSVTDNMAVKAGDVLFVVDPEPYRIALSQADASLAAARLNVAQLRAAYSQASANEHTSAGDVKYFQSELDRQQALSRKGVTTQAATDSARRDLKKAQDGLAAAQEVVAGARAALGGDPAIETDKHPTVLAALAAREKAAFNLAQTTVRAPADGVLYQAASFSTGQFVATGTPLFALVQTGDSWIDANFKETQLEHITLGQKAEIVLDAFPDKPLTATVEAIGAGTGAEFSLLPAQNATGNWVKVTQRIPVRLKVDTPDAALALRSGMSATVTVDTGKARGFDGLPKIVRDWLPASLSTQAIAAQ